MTTVFISYSWDSESHKKRIKEFVGYLRRHRIEVIFDEDARLGEPLPNFMEKGVKDSDYFEDAKECYVDMPNFLF